jgi:hypothetical protein
MKKYLLIFLALWLVDSLFAADLVLIKTNSYKEVKSLSQMEQLSMNYLGNGFVIATMYDEIKLDFILLEKNSWAANHNYFLVFADQVKDSTYRREVEHRATILYQTKELLIIKTVDQNQVNIDPPPDGSMARIWNRIAALPDNLALASKSPLAADPFIVARRF